MLNLPEDRQRGTLSEIEIISLAPLWWLQYTLWMCGSETDSDSNSEIYEPSSNNGWVHFHTNILGKSMNPSLIPAAIRLNSKSDSGLTLWCGNLSRRRKWLNSKSSLRKVRPGKLHTTFSTAALHVICGLQD